MLAQGEVQPKASETLGRRPNVSTSPARGDRNTHSCGPIQDSVAPAGAPCSCRALSQGCASASPWANISCPYRGWKPPKATPSNYWPGAVEAFCFRRSRLVENQTQSNGPWIRHELAGNPLEV